MHQRPGARSQSLVDAARRPATIFREWRRKPAQLAVEHRGPTAAQLAYRRQYAPAPRHRTGRSGTPPLHSTAPRLRRSRSSAHVLAGVTGRPGAAVPIAQRKSRRIVGRRAVGAASSLCTREAAQPSAPAAAANGELLACRQPDPVNRKKEFSYTEHRRCALTRSQRLRRFPRTISPSLHGPDGAEESTGPPDLVSEKARGGGRQEVTS